MLAATCSGVCGVGASICGGERGGCALGARGFLLAAGFVSSGGGSFRITGTRSAGASSIILGLFLLPGGRPRRLGVGSGIYSGSVVDEACRTASS